MAEATAVVEEPEATEAAEEPDVTQEVEGESLEIPEEQLVEPGKLTFGTTGNAAPFTLMTDEGELTGYDVELCREIAKRLGLEPDPVVLEWAGILPGLSAGRFDIVCTGVGRTPERLSSGQFLFSDATIQDGSGTVVRAGDDRVQTWEDVCDLRLGGVRGAYYTGDVQEHLEENFGCQAELVEYPGETELFLDLENERIDIAAMGHLVAAIRARDNPNLELSPLSVLNPTTKGLPISNDSPMLLEVVNSLIAEFSESGQLEEWHQQWFGVSAMPHD
jgi:ABC-type amino acid transport substrate-binding protein